MADAVHWADVIAENMLKENCKHFVATSITPSGSINIGEMREAITADAVYRALHDRGGNADFICVVDNYAPLHEVYHFLPENYVEHVGKPISEIPCPCGDCANYAEHFLRLSLEALKQIGINPKIYRTDEMYRAGRYNEAVKTALNKRDDIAKIIEEFSGKSISSGWSPFNPRCDKCGRLTKTGVMGFNPEVETVNYACACGYSGKVPVAGGGKLTWHVEWPARWAVLGITIESFRKEFGKIYGKENESKSSSYDAGKQIAKEIYMCKAPYPVVCEQITPAKPGIKYSSTGAPVSVSDMLEVMPPEFLRYLIIRTKPEKRIHIDPVQSLLAFADEYERLRARFRGKDPSFGIFKKRIYELSRLTEVSQSEIPFKQMTTIYQVARGDFDQILKIVSRSGFSTESEKCITELTDCVSRWLELYAPPYAKFNVKENVPVQAATLSELQKAFLSAFSALIRARRKLSGDEYHKLIYSAKEDGSELNRKITEKINTQVKRQTDPRDAAPQIDPEYLFKAIYISLLGQSSGPRAGWFISSLEKEFLIKRFEEASTYSPEKR